MKKAYVLRKNDLYSRNFYKTHLIVNNGSFGTVFSVQSKETEECYAARHVKSKSVRGNLHVSNNCNRCYIGPKTEGKRAKLRAVISSCLFSNRIEKLHKITFNFFLLKKFKKVFLGLILRFSNLNVLHKGLPMQDWIFRLGM